VKTEKTLISGLSKRWRFRDDSCPARTGGVSWPTGQAGISGGRGRVVAVVTDSSEFPFPSSKFAADAWGKDRKKEKNKRGFNFSVGFSTSFPPARGSGFGLLIGRRPAFGQAESLAHG
jgi:hypothetical protein